MTTKEVNIYIETSIKSLKRQNGTVGYVLKIQTIKGPATLTKIEPVINVTDNQAQIIALTKALARINETCRLAIYTESNYLASAYTLNWVDKWKQNSWQNAKGKMIANCKEWSELDKRLKEHTFYFCVKQNHEYREWLRSETERKAKEMDKDV